MPTAAIFRDEDEENIDLPVLVAPDLGNFARSNASLISALQRSQIPLRSIDDDEAEEILVLRLSEHLAARARTVGLTGTDTVVDTNRGGDTVLYCKGYFVSTATAFGTSTPARNKIPAGRYTFGIAEPNGPRFEGVIWTCPTNVRLRLP